MSETNTGVSPTGASAPSTSTSTPSTSTPSKSSSSNAMSPSDFKSRLRGPDNSFEVDASDPEPVESSDEEEVETNFQASDEEPEQVEEVEQTEDTESTEEDWSWAQELKDFRQLHGLELKDVVKALSEGRLPDEFMDIIKLKLKRGDQEWESPLSRARNEAMMHQDYTAKLQDLAKERNEYHADKNEFIEMLQSWKTNPDALLSGLERLEFPVLEAAKLLAKRHRELEAMTPREREFYEKNQALERQMAKEKYEQRRQAKTSTEAQVKAEADKRSDFVSSAAQALFNKHQIPMDERTFGLFLKKFTIISESYPPGAQWTQEMVEQAFGATQYDYEQALVKREAAQQTTAAPAKPKQKFDSPAREAVARLQTPQAQPQKKGQKGGATTVKDFRRLALGRD